MATISSRDFYWLSQGSSKCLVLSGEEYIRPMAWGTNWTRLRLGLLAAVPYDGFGVDLVAIKFDMGFCAGYQGMLSPSPTGALVMRWSSQTAGPGNVGYASNANGKYFYTADDICWVWRQGSLLAGATNHGNAYIPLSEGTTLTNHRMIWIVDVHKIGPQNLATTNIRFNTQTIHQNSATWLDAGYETLVDAVEQPATSGANTLAIAPTQTNATGAYAMTTFANTTDQATTVPWSIVSILDSVTISWNKTSIPLEIYGIAVSRQA